MSDNTMAALRGAGFPRSVASTTLPKEHLPALRTIIEKGEYKTKMGLASYVIQAAKHTPADAVRAAMAAGLFGKELLLSRNPARYVPLSGLMHAVRLFTYDTTEEPIFDVFSEIGQGFIVIPDFSDQYCHPNFAIWREALSLLGQHVARGGGLVLGVDAEWTLSPDQHTAAFCVTAAEFPIIKV